MATEIKNTGNSLYEVSTTVSGEQWAAAQEKALKKLANNVTVKGFRKGKAPLDKVRKVVSQIDIANEAINQSLNDAYRAVIAEHDLHPYLQPEVKVTDLREDGYDATFIITTAPVVELGQYKDLNIAVKKVKVTKKDVDEKINKDLESNAELVLKEGPAAMGDTVVFDFKGYIDGKEFEGGSAENYSLVLGSNQFIPGFEDQLVGVTPDSKKDVLVKFPEQYVKDLAGKDAKFVCMIHEIKEKKVPELNDEYVAGLNGSAKTVEEYRKEVEASVRSEKENAAKQEQMETIISTIIKGSKVTIGDKVLDLYAEDEKKNLINQIESNGLSYEQYQEITGMNDAKILENLRADALTKMTESLVMNEIAKKENLLISRAELNAYYNQVAQQYNMKVEDVEKAFANNTSNIVNNLLGNKLNRFLVANNTPEEKKEEAPEVPIAAEEKKEEAVEEKKEEAPKAKKTTAKKTTAKKTTKKAASEEPVEENKEEKAE